MNASHKLCFALLTTLFALSTHAENLYVDCRKGHEKSAEFTTISAAVAKIAKKAAHEALGPNTITVTGRAWKMFWSAVSTT